MEEHDLHGYKLAEAEEFFFQLLNRVRMAKEEQEIAFITGIGVIQKRLQELAKEHELYFYIPMANAGVIVIHFT